LSGVIPATSLSIEVPQQEIDASVEHIIIKQCQLERRGSPPGRHKVEIERAAGA
jgi:hypothetical protein